MIIRKAKIKDLEDIVSLSCESASYHKRLNSYYDTDKNIKDILRKSLRKNIYSSNSCVFIVEENNNIFGYLLGFKINRPEMFKVKKSGLIADIFIEDNCRRKGAGNKLIEVCFDWFKQNNISFIEISVEVSNDKAMNFWNKNGFKDVSIEKIKKI